MKEVPKVKGGELQDSQVLLDNRAPFERVGNSRRSSYGGSFHPRLKRLDRLIVLLPDAARTAGFTVTTRAHQTRQMPRRCHHARRTAAFAAQAAAL